jgi:hypothetical protein
VSSALLPRSVRAQRRDWSIAVGTQHGNSPSRGPTLVIAHGSEIYVVASHKDWEGGREVHDRTIDTRMRSLWAPLPETHPRVQLWIRHVYKHMAHCYKDPETIEHGRPATIIYPVPEYQLRTFVGNRRLSARWSRGNGATVDQTQDDICERAR